MFTTRDEQLGALLGAGIDSLDLPDEHYLYAENIYKQASQFLKTYWSDAEFDGAMYPQGSMRLGTITRLIKRNDEYDLDMVCRHDLGTDEISKADLKADIGAALELFIEENPHLDLELDDEGRRCWTFKHRKLPFHLDVLPALPDADSPPHGILVTDTQAFRWHHSAPIAYADWFLERQREEWMAGARVVAERKNIDVEALPRREFKTTLQRTVQALKRHRDIYFLNDWKYRPASIIITTLAAQAYRPAGGLFETLSHVVQVMPSLVVDAGISGHVVANPVQPQENFADRWCGDPKRANRFFEWLEQANADFAGVAKANGLDEILSKTATILGARPAEQARHVFGSSLRDLRLSGELSTSGAAATLIVGRQRPVPDHVFHGA